MYLRYKFKYNMTRWFNILVYVVGGLILLIFFLKYVSPENLKENNKLPK